MATDFGGADGFPDQELFDNRKRPPDTDLHAASSKRVHQHDGGGYPSVAPGVGGTYHLKILVPSVAAGAIIGKGGETIAQLQKEAGARVKMSKSNDFYPGTTERVCLITGSVEGVQKINEFIMEKIKEKPDPNAKIAIDFDHKQTAEREKQVKILVPNSTAGMIIGKGGSFIKQIKEDSGAYVQISQKSKDHALAERCITVIGDIDNNKKACTMILSKIVEDPQSGSCLNVSYQDVTGPVANFNPTGSPYANPASVVHSAANTSCNNNTSYSSNGSLNSLSPTTQMNVAVSGGAYAPQAGGQHPQSGPGAGAVAPYNPAVASAAQAVESMKLMLRSHGFSEQATQEITQAMSTLASYGVLGHTITSGSMLAAGNAGINGILASQGAPTAQGPAQHSQPQQQAAAAAAAAAALYSAGAMDANGSGGSSAAAATAAAAAAAAAAANLFGPVGASGLGPATPMDMSVFTGGSPQQGGAPPHMAHPRDRYETPPTVPHPMAYDPFSRRTSSPTLAASPPLNNNSFGLGTGLGGRKSPTPTELKGAQGGDLIKRDIEVGENIVGAILGPGGKSLVEIQRFSGATIQISKKGIFAPGTRNRIVTISGTQNSVSTAQYLIEQQIAEEESKRAQQNFMGTLR